MEEKKYCYEGMFLLDAGKGTFEVTAEPLQKILARSEVDVVMMKQWDERKLAYEIKDRKRGLYVLTYLKMDPAKVVEVEHECQLSEDILRMLLIRMDSISDENLSANTPAELVQVQVAEAERAAEVAAEAAAAAEADKVTEADADEPVNEVTEALEDAAAVVHESIAIEEDTISVQQAAPVEQDPPDSEDKPTDE